MVIYSLLTVNTARSFLNTSDTVIRSDVEYRTIIRAQDEIEEIKLISREDENSLNPNHVDYRFANHPINSNETFGANNEYSDTYVIFGSSEYLDESDPLIRRYKVTIIVENRTLEPTTRAELVYIKSFER